MAYVVPHEVFVSLGFDLDAEIAAYASAKDAHRFTTGVPAPTTYPIVAHIVDIFGGAYEVEPEPEPEPLPEPPVPNISPRQLWIGLMMEEIITPAEADAASIGAIPSFIDAVIAQLPSEVQQTAARVTVRTALTIERTSPLLQAALASLPTPPTEEAVDQFFRDYSQV